MDFEEELDVHLRSRSTLICIVSLEEERIISAVQAVCKRLKRALHVWDHADYFTTLPGQAAGGLQQVKDPLTLLETIEKTDTEAVFILRDFHQCWKGQDRIVRKLRNLAQSSSLPVTPSSLPRRSRRYRKNSGTTLSS